MAITDTQRALRQRNIGSSDTPRILNVSPYGNCYDVWCEKTQQMEEWAGNKSTAFGNYAEPMLVKYCEDETGIKFIRNRRRVRGDGIHAANYDALCQNKSDRAACECKAMRFPDGWGQVGTDEVPLHVWFQCQHQMFVADLDVVWVPVVVAMDFRLYKVDRDQERIDEMTEINRQFWHEHVLPNVPPDSFTPQLDTLKRICRVPNKTADLTQQAYLLGQWEAAKKADKAAKEALKHAQAELVAALDDAEAGDFGPELGTVTYFTQNRKEYTVKASTFPVLRHQKPKQEKP